MSVDNPVRKGLAAIELKTSGSVMAGRIGAGRTHSGWASRAMISALAHSPAEMNRM